MGFISAMQHDRDNDHDLLLLIVHDVCTDSSQKSFKTNTDCDGTDMMS